MFGTILSIYFRIKPTNMKTKILQIISDFISVLFLNKKNNFCYAKAVSKNNFDYKAYRQ